MDFMAGHTLSYWRYFAFSKVPPCLFLAARNFAGTLWSTVTQKPWGCTAASFTSTFYSVLLFVCIFLLYIAAFFPAVVTALGMLPEHFSSKFIK